ncbi:redoxin domain-containing protein [Algibacter pacificus]|uniref:redoxin domain-containing protein n=1 Tax=Algibacter pacificus TaxID=2599389 RepID=UPI0011CACC2C|nr:redoxin domain-containing protein [Algibacter pacificus]
MNLKKSIKFSLFILLTLIGILIIFNTKFFKTSNDNITSLENDFNKLITHYKFFEVKNDNTIIKDFTLYDENNNTLNISDLLIGKKLIFRFAEINCNVCIVNEFENIKKHINNYELSPKDLIIISSYQNPNSLHIFKRLNKLNEFHIYNLKNNVLKNIELDSLNIPYFFVLDKNFIISNSFIPIKGANNRTSNYLKNITKELKTRKD